MDSGKQQIVYYFIEEAKEHLETLEKGLLDLKSALADTETVNEMFRAAHSVKGGAAMLGFDSIKTTAHRLEDCFKILQEHPINVDQKLESLFLKGYDTLQDLVERLQDPAGLQADEAEKTVQAAEPNFAQLQSYLNQLASNGNGEKGGVAVAAPPAAFVPPANLGAETNNILKEMLQLFKQNETPESRQRLGDLCQRLLGLSNGVEPWNILVQTAQRAIANPKNSYRNLAPLVIKEIKQASELVIANKANAISPSPGLQQMAASIYQQIIVPLEPNLAAKALCQSFDKQQLLEIVALLQKATA
jgi:chemotaxis protein histidine kinase CheA